MRIHAPAPLQLLAVTIALLRGLGEFAALQRWRLRSWVGR